MQNLNSFRKSLQFTLQWEGGYVFDESDPGGDTKWGISQRAYPSLDIKNLTPAQAADIYARDYWDKVGGDQIPFPMCTAVFDSAVNNGVSRAVSWMKQASTPKAFLDLRRSFYYQVVKNNPQESKFLKGWLNRLNDLVKFVDLNTTPIGEDLPDMNKNPVPFAKQ